MAQSARPLDRRRVLQTMASASIASIAGCLGDDDGTDDDGGTDGDDGTDDSDELGERVPTLAMAYYTVGGLHRDVAEVLSSNMEEVGFDLEVEEGEVASVLGDMGNDARLGEIYFGALSLDPARLDPSPLLQWGGGFIWEAGAVGGNNYSQFTNCEYSSLQHEQSQTADVEERRSLVNEMQQILGAERVCIPYMPYFAGGALREDLVSANNLGEAKLDMHNEDFLVELEVLDGDTFVVGDFPRTVDTLNWLPSPAGRTDAYHQHLTHSPLLSYNHNLDLQEILAGGVNVSDDGTVITVGLRTGGTFHNGDPITPEDVKFSYEYLEEFADAFSFTSTQDYSSIDVDDDSIEFTFNEPTPTFITTVLPTYPILPEAHYRDIGAADDPENLPDNVDDFVGSGPFEVIDFRRGDTLSLGPHDGHPYWGTPGHNIQFVNMEDVRARVDAFSEGRIHASLGTSFDFVRDIREEIPEEQRLTTIAIGWTTRWILPVQSIAPGKFVAFREALGKALNRQLISDLAFEGEVPPLTGSTPLSPTHPFHPPEDMQYHYSEDPSGDVEEAISTLEEAGWQRDGDGNWRYPADADLSPRWPEGETPDPEEFPCLTDDGGFTPDY